MKQWTRLIGVASETTSTFAVTTDSSGNVFVSGETEGGL
ncbi:MAG: SBBP repeat-containing protein, partial [Proteobacteria bacterium]|nr:SBBP repeat-containing protein [Pseudomonadota bacterium]